MTILAKRLLFGALILGGILLLLLADHLTGGSGGLLTLCILLGCLGWLEFGRLARLPRRAALIPGLVTVGGGIAAEWLFLNDHLPARGHGAFLTLLPLPLLFLLLLTGLRGAPGRERVCGIALAMLGILYLLLPLFCCLNLRFGPDDGELWLLALILVVKGNDIGAYLVGRRLGRTPLAAVSPRKTVEGSVGGLILGLLIAIALALLPSSPCFGIGGALLVGLLAGVAGQAGDLAESFLKRSFGSKDSGSLVPTFGGPSTSSIASSSRRRW
ncbi:MAG: phosphatidate cytidylyltransferase [Planctomycetota bacterium]